MRLGQGGAATLSRRAKEKPCQGSRRARPACIPGARRRRFRHSVSHVGGRRCASCARRKRKQLSRYAQAPLQAEALQSAANTRKHKNCSEKTEDGSKLCFLRWICQTQRGRQMQSQTLIGQSSPVDLPTPAGLSNAAARRQPLQAEFPRCIANPCEIIKCSRKVAQLLPSRVSSVHL